MITFATILEALSLPVNACLKQRVPKKLLQEQGAPTQADKRSIQEQVEELLWLASLKPTNCGVPVYRDDLREYLEIAVLAVTLRSPVKGNRLLTLIHRAIPYPVVLIGVYGETVSLTLSHKRASLGDGGKVVLDGKMIGTSLERLDTLEKFFLSSLVLSAQPADNLFALYQGWIERMEALAVARITTKFSLPESPQQAVMRRTALAEHAHLSQEITKLRTQAVLVKQINRRVEMNLKIKQMEKELDGLRGSLLLTDL